MNFEIFNAVILILAIIVAGNFLRDGKSNYLEGALCILIYIIIAVSRALAIETFFINALYQIASFSYPNPIHGAAGTSEASPATGAGAEGGHKLRFLK